MSEEGTRTSAPAYTGTDPNILIGRLSAKNKQFRMERDEAIRSATDQKKELDRLAGENQELKEKVDGSVSQKRLKELEQKIRENEHRKVFDQRAKVNFAREDSLDDLWQLSGYKVETDEIDPATIDAVIEEQKLKRPIFFGEDPKFAPRDLKEGIPKPAVGSGQGQRAGGSSTGFQLPEENDPRWSDAKWQWQNRDKISDAINNRLNNGVV